MVLLLGSTISITHTDANPSLAAEVQRGVNYVAWQKGDYQTREAEQALRNLSRTNTNWVAIVVTCYQRTIRDTHITCLTDSRTPTDQDLAHVIDLAHSLGLDVMLKPHLDLDQDDTHWRGQIGTSFGQTDWDDWFTSYRNFINHYAELAQTHRVEQFSVGCELQGTSQHKTEWLEVIKGVRARFSGALTYAANHGEEWKIKWWDALDFMGVDAYYPLTSQPDPTLDELETQWKKIAANLAALSRQWRNKDIILTEVGYRSVQGTNSRPGDWQYSAPSDPQEQANCYQALMNTLGTGNAPWLHGIYWWSWWKDECGYTPYRQPAEEILRRFYGSPIPEPALAAPH
jgi:hypothetical protein